MKQIYIDPEIHTKIDQFILPEELGFGTILAPIMIEANFEEGEWQDFHLRPYGPLVLDPCCKVFHYAQEIFEGLKAYHNPKSEFPNLFRPKLNAERFDYSATRMAMPLLPPGMFVKCAEYIAYHLKKLVPKNRGESLYIRPFMFATQPHIGVKPSASYKFLVIASPSGYYFKGGSVKSLIQRKYIRAAKGGTGSAKTGGNYAASLLSTEDAYKNGYEQTLWLDGIERKYIEEGSGMNFMCIVGDTLQTPTLTDTILDGITRKSIIELAKSMGLKVEEKRMLINDLLFEIKNQTCTEAFFCGTAAIVTPINSLCEEDGTCYSLKNPEGPWAKKLKEKLLDIQSSQTPDLFDWIYNVSKID